ADAAHALCSGVVVAHVRDASVGPVTELNTHPFVHGPWLFAHNGTVARYEKHDRVRAALEAEIDRPLRYAIRGDTDSERCLYVLLTRLAAMVPAGTPPALEHVCAAMAQTIATIVAVVTGS
ncbi:MAG TPA: class II glutamine amidotransferase, partial [Verrucomicrobiae bacterium]